MKIAAGEELWGFGPADEGSVPAAKALSEKGGAARAAKMTPERHAKIASDAANNRIIFVVCLDFVPGDNSRWARKTARFCHDASSREAATEAYRMDELMEHRMRLQVQWVDMRGGYTEGIAWETAVIDEETGKKVGFVENERSPRKRHVFLFAGKYRGTFESYEECHAFAKGIEAVLNHMTAIDEGVTAGASENSN